MSDTTEPKKKGKSKLANKVEPSVPITMIAIEDLIDPLYYLTRENDKQVITELALSIADNGLLHPLIVKKVKHQYRVLSGAHRLAAVDMIGWEKVPCRIIKATIAGELMMTLAENINRADVQPLSVAELILELQTREKLSQEDIAEKFGKSQPWVAAKLKLLSTTELTQHELSAGEISEGIAAELSRLPDPETEKAALAKVIARDMTVAAIREMVSDYEKHGTLEPEVKAHEELKAEEPEISGPIMLECGVGNHKIELVDSQLVRLCDKHFEMLKQLFMRDGEEFFHV